MERCTRHDLARGPAGLCSLCQADVRRLSAPRRDQARRLARLVLALLAFFATFATLLSLCDTK